MTQESGTISWWKTAQLPLLVAAFLTLPLLVLQWGAKRNEQYTLESDLATKKQAETRKEDASYPPPHHYIDGNLSVAPGIRSLPHCVNIQIRGQENTTYSLDEAIDPLAQISDGPLSVGLVFVEDPDSFVAFGHLFHTLEFLVNAFDAFTSLQRKLPGAKESMGISWLYMPLLSYSEMCGSYHSINCLVLNLLWGSRFNGMTSSHPSPIQNTSDVFPAFGLDVNPPYMQAWHEAYRGIYWTRPKQGNTWVPDTDPTANGRRYHDMMDQVDMVLLVDRNRCKEAQPVRINKMWTHLLDTFPAEEWHKRLIGRHLPHHTNSKELSNSAQSSNHHRRRLVVGYVDRQNTDRRLLDSEHEWLLQYLSSQQDVIDFRHLHMENYTVRDQVEMASQLEMIIGVHGNGLSHQFFMRPDSYVLEMYCDFPLGFKFDYATSARLMKHTYRGIVNGEVINSTRIESLDYSVVTETRLRDDPTWRIDSPSEWNIQAGRTAISEFVEHAVRVHPRQ